MLGSVTRFEAIPNEALQSTLIDAYRGGERRVLLLTIQEDGQALVEDLTGQIALAAGRGPMSAIDGVELDLKEFARTGEVGVRGKADGRASAKADKISIRDQIALERTRRSRGGPN
jgi:hypothetical protein